MRNLYILNVKKELLANFLDKCDADPTCPDIKDYANAWTKGSEPQSFAVKLDNGKYYQIWGFSRHEIGDNVTLYGDQSGRKLGRGIIVSKHSTMHPSMSQYVLK